MDGAVHDLMLGLCRFSGVLPPIVLRAMGRMIGEMVFRVDRRHRSITRKNLGFAFGLEIDEARVHRSARLR